MDAQYFYGVVEDVNDPLKIGRVRVRCHYWHTEDTNKMPTESLPWCVVLNPVTSASSSGVGRSPTGLKIGSTVFGIFQDEDQQYPLVLGSIFGVDGNAPDIPALALGTTTTREQETFDAALGGSFTTPNDAYAAEYPNNHAMVTGSGHSKEYDDTENAERIKETHRTGTFYEILPDGSRITKILGEDYEIVLNGKNVHVTGDVNITVTGNANIKAATMNMEADTFNSRVGNYNLTITGESNIRYEGDKYEFIGADTHTTKDTGTDFSQTNPPIRFSEIDAEEADSVINSQISNIEV